MTNIILTLFFGAKHSIGLVSKTPTIRASSLPVTTTTNGSPAVSGSCGINCSTSDGRRRTGDGRPTRTVLGRPRLRLVTRTPSADRLRLRTFTSSSAAAASDSKGSAPRANGGGGGTLDNEPKMKVAPWANGGGGTLEEEPKMKVGALGDRGGPGRTARGDSGFSGF